jgi:hypothetical protein
MVDNSNLRKLVSESTKGLWGTLNPIGGNLGVFGTTKGVALSSQSVYYDVSAFYASTKTYMGNTYKYVYNDFKEEIKPRRFQRFNAGVKLTETEAPMDGDAIRAMVQTATDKQMRALNQRIEAAVIGYNSEVALLSCMNGQGTASSSIIDPADCNATPGTPLNCQAVKFTGAAETERNLESTIGAAIVGIGGKVVNTTTGETILHNDGTDTFDAWVCPQFYHILEKGHDLLDAAEHDPRTYFQAAQQDFKCTFHSSMHIENSACTTGLHPAMVVTANTKENFLLVNVEQPQWTPWKELDNGEEIAVVKRYKAGIGSLAKPYLDGTQAYKAQFAIDAIAYNA